MCAVEQLKRAWVERIAPHWFDSTVDLEMGNDALDAVIAIESGDDPDPQRTIRSLESMIHKSLCVQHLLDEYFRIKMRMIIDDACTKMISAWCEVSSKFSHTHEELAVGSWSLRQMLHVLSGREKDAVQVRLILRRLSEEHESVGELADAYYRVQAEMNDAMLRLMNGGHDGEK